MQDAYTLVNFLEGEYIYGLFMEVKLTLALDSGEEISSRLKGETGLKSFMIRSPIKTTKNQK